MILECPTMMWWRHHRVMAPPKDCTDTMFENPSPSHMLDRPCDLAYLRTPNPGDRAFKLGLQRFIKPGHLSQEGMLSLQSVLCICQHSACDALAIPRAGRWDRWCCFYTTYARGNKDYWLSLASRFCRVVAKKSPKLENLRISDEPQIPSWPSPSLVPPIDCSRKWNVIVSSSWHCFRLLLEILPPWHWAQHWDKAFRFGILTPWWVP